MNSAVTATGMSVKATTGTNLTISNASSGTYSFTADLDPNVTNSTMKPATSFNGTTFGKAKVDAKAFDNFAIEGLTYSAWSTYIEDVPANDTGEDKRSTYVIEGTYYLKALEADSFNRIGVDIEFSNTTSAAIAKSIRVAVTIGSTTKIYAPVEGYDSTYTTSNGSTALATPTISTNTDLFEQAIGTTAVPVKVAIWFEGQDQNCHSANAVAAINISPYAITLIFTGSKV